MKPDELTNLKKQYLTAIMEGDTTKAEALQNEIDTNTKVWVRQLQDGSFITSPTPPGNIGLTAKYLKERNHVRNQ